MADDNDMYTCDVQSKLKAVLSSSQPMHRMAMCHAHSNVLANNMNAWHHVHAVSVMMFYLVVEACKMLAYGRILTNARIQVC